MTRTIASDALAPTDSRSWWRTPALVIAFLSPVLITVHTIRALTVYLTADAGHALADADALRGHGVRNIGHAPVFPALTAAVTSFTSDIGALRVLAIIGTLGMSAAFYIFVRGRSGSRFAEVLGTLLFGLAPPTAEALGYFGVVMLIAIALAIAAMRAIDDWLAAPSPRRAFTAGVLIALTAFTHTVGFVWLMQVGAIVCLSELVRTLRSKGHDDGDTLRKLLRTIPIVLFFTVAGVAEATSFLGGLANPARFHPAVRNLKLIGDFGFRGGAAFWVGLLCASLVVLPLAAWVDEGLRRLATWSLVAGLIAVANLIAIDTDIQYQARQTYLLALPAAVAVVCLAALLRRVSVTRAPFISTLVLLLAGSGIALISERAFNERLSVTMPYYGHVDANELAALEWLHDHRGVTLVAGRASDFYSGSSYAWMIEGVAKARAFAAAEGFTNLYADQRHESDDAATFLAGANVTINHDLMAGISLRGDSVHVLRRLQDAWSPVAEITAIPVDGETARVKVSATRSGLSVDATGSTLQIDAHRADEPQRSGQTGSGTKPGHVAFQESEASVLLSIRPRVTDAANPRSFATFDLLARHHVRWIWVWDEPSSDLLMRLVDRGLKEEHREGNVVILRVPPA